MFANSPKPCGRRSSSARHEKLTLWSSLRARTVAVSIAPRARGGSPTKLRRISSWVPRNRVNVRLARGPAPGTLQLKVKFSPTGCQGGSGISSTRSGRSARDQNLGSSDFRSLGRRDQRTGGRSFRGRSRELTESSDEPARLQCAARTAEEADRLGLRLSDVHQLPSQPAQTSLGPVSA